MCYRSSTLELAPKVNELLLLLLNILRDKELLYEPKQNEVIADVRE